MPSVSEQTLPRCVLCGVHCPIGARLDAFGRAHTVYPADLGVTHGACVLALTAVRMFSAANRVFSPQAGPSLRPSPNGGGRRVGEAAVEAALDDLARRLSSVPPDQVALCVDINRPLEGIAAAAALRDQALPGAQVSAFVPPQDWPFAATGLGAGPSHSEIAGCDLVLAVGDVFSSHPAMAGFVRDMQQARRQNRLISLDSAPGRTSRGADQAILLTPDRIAPFLCALAVAAGAGEVKSALGGLGAAEVCERAQLDAAAVDNLKKALTDAKSPGILVAANLGRYTNSTAVLSAACQLAQVCGGRLWPLPLGTNSAALGALNQALALQSTAATFDAIDSGQTKVLLVVGFDPASVFPPRMWSHWNRRCGTIAWAASLESDFADQARIVLPLALGWEESGHKLSPEGAAEPFAAWLPAPRGVLTVEDLMQGLAGRLGASALTIADMSKISALPAGSVSASAHISRDVVEVRRPPVAPAAWLVGAHEPHGYTGGLSTDGLDWQRRLESTVRFGGATVAGGESRAQVPAGGVQSAGGATVVSLPAHWPQLRELVEWAAPHAHGPVANPAIVSLENLQPQKA